MNAFPAGDWERGKSYQARFLGLVYTQVFESCLPAFRSPLTPLKKGGTRVKVPQFIGGFRGIFNDFGFIQRCNLQEAYQAMLISQQTETEKLALYRAAADAARLAEWEFHNAVLAMKEVVRGQYGSDSDQAQAVGLKKKSDRKRPSRKKTVAIAS